ncbi:twin-arginine translocase subunit TatC [Rossellomorea aquimaris]|uniref:twin-arginine translocase subunit TatC n=1 Tax=Rossellomorea aquimaris TaxID=189382 RepID=UPI001CD7C596|nr:twin-arginine translocase subunit TatC [Rossellomorea aquimaris]MCA1056981.1 twin-arginine translocase subunit TatC [Rossellomorea aquimaris]
MNKQEFIQIHLKELRQRIITVAVAYAVLLIAGFLSVKHIYRWILNDAGLELTVLGPSDILWVYFTISSICAFTLLIPLLTYQVWAFVKPALKPEERRATLFFIPLLFLLFLSGLAFGYFIVFPMVFDFIVSLSEEMFETMFTAEKYFKFLFQIVFPLGLLFELPAIVLFLTEIGILTPGFMKKYRKYVYLGLVVLSAVITPPDFVSQLFVLIPMFLLYEISIWLCTWRSRKKAANSVYHSKGNANEKSFSNL